VIPHRWKRGSGPVCTLWRCTYCWARPEGFHDRRHSRGVSVGKKRVVGGIRRGRALRTSSAGGHLFVPSLLRRALVLLSQSKEGSQKQSIKGGRPHFLN